MNISFYAVDQQQYLNSNPSAFYLYSTKTVRPLSNKTDLLFNNNTDLLFSNNTDLLSSNNIDLLFSTI